MTNFQTNFETKILALGSPPEVAPGVFFQHLFENGPWLLLFSKSQFGPFFEISPSSRGRKLP